ALVGAGAFAFSARDDEVVLVHRKRARVPVGWNKTEGGLLIVFARACTGTAWFGIDFFDIDVCSVEDGNRVERRVRHKKTLVIRRQRQCGGIAAREFLSWRIG